jgi:hypothetical protein
VLEHSDHSMRCRSVVQEEADLDDAEYASSDECVTKERMNL